MINNINILFFSPTGTSEMIINTVAKAIGFDHLTSCDLTCNEKEYTVISNELSVFAVPVYGGRVPAVAADRLRKIKGNNSPAVIIVVYGNRDYDDALLELKNIVIEQGFKPIAAAAFVGEHSYSTGQYPIATNRPDKTDLDIASSFGCRIKEILSNKNNNEDIIEVPGNYPYKALSQKPDVSAITIESLCNKCGLCVSVCPTGSIIINEIVETDGAKCILCCACVKACPGNARVNINDFIKAKQEWLLNNCSLRKEPQLFIRVAETGC